MSGLRLDAGGGPRGRRATLWTERRGFDLVAAGTHRTGRRSRSRTVTLAAWRTRIRRDRRAVRRRSSSASGSSAPSSRNSFTNIGCTASSLGAGTAAAGQRIEQAAGDPRPRLAHGQYRGAGQRRGGEPARGLGPDDVADLLNHDNLLDGPAACSQAIPAPSRIPLRRLAPPRVIARYPQLRGVLRSAWAGLRQP